MKRESLQGGLNATRTFRSAELAKDRQSCADDLSGDSQSRNVDSCCCVVIIVGVVANVFVINVSGVLGRKDSCTQLQNFSWSFEEFLIGTRNLGLAFVW